MNRGCLVALTFVTVSVGTFILYALILILLMGPAPAGDSGGQAMGTFMFALVSGPIVGLLAGGTVAFLVWKTTRPDGE